MYKAEELSRKSWASCFRRCVTIIFPFSRRLLSVIYGYVTTTCCPQHPLHARALGEGNYSPETSSGNCPFAFSNVVSPTPINITSKWPSHQKWHTLNRIKKKQFQSTKIDFCSTRRFTFKSSSGSHKLYALVAIRDFTHGTFPGGRTSGKVWTCLHGEMCSCSRRAIHSSSITSVEPVMLNKSTVRVKPVLNQWEQ